MAAVIASARAFDVAGLVRRVGLTPAVLAVSALSAGLAGFVFWTVAARRFDTAAVGVSGAWAALLPLAGTAAAMGFAETLLRHLPHSSLRSLVARAALWCVPAVVVVAAALSFFPLVADRSAELWHGWAVAFPAGLLVLSATVLSSLAAAIALARGRPLVLLFEALPAAAVKLALVVLLPAGDPRSVGVAVVAGAVAGSAAIAGALAWTEFWDPEPYRAAAAPTGAFALGNWFAALFSVLPASLAPSVVAARAGAEQAAFVTVALMMMPGLTLVSSVLARSLFAEAAREPAQAAVMARARLRQALVASAALSLAVAVLSAPLMAVVGRDFSAGASGALRWCALAAFLSVPGYVAETLLNVRGRVAAYSLTSALTTAVSVSGTLLFAHVGAVWVCAGWAVAAAVGSAVAVLLCPDLWRRT